MSQFIQLHCLTSYPLSNPNRDDTGRPKSAIYGGAPRLRLSSQALKRAIRTSDRFQQQLSGKLGARTQRIGEVVLDALKNRPLIDKDRAAIAEAITDVFGKVDAEAIKKNAAHVRTRQLAFISPEERAAALDWAERAANGEKLPDKKELKKLILRTADGAADIAMFGRMLADADGQRFNREAAVQLSHAFTTHRAIVEDDYYTAVDDLKKSSEDAGAGFIGEAGFGSGVFYVYSCIDRSLLEKNLDGDTALVDEAIEGYIHALTSATPSGKRASFAHHTRADYLLAERGDQQPRSLAPDFMKPISGDDVVQLSISALESHSEAVTKAYGACSEATACMNVRALTGTIDDVVALARGA